MGVMSFSAPKSTYKLIPPAHNVNGSSVIIQPCFTRAFLTTSWKISLAGIFSLLSYEIYLADLNPTIGGEIQKTCVKIIVDFILRNNAK
jgi:hypothetical protein